MTPSAIQARAAAAVSSAMPGFASQPAGFAAALAKHVDTLNRQTRDLASLIPPTATPARPAPATLGSDSSQTYDTDQGRIALDIDAYFAPPTGEANRSLPPLLWPSEDNIRALSSHVAQRLPAALAAYGIPSAPASVRYDSMGQPVFPDDYPYTERFRAMLADQPALARQLSTIHALSSHLAEMRKSLPFQQEYAAAKTQAQIDAVVNKYSYLFSGQRSYSVITVELAGNGAGVCVLADGQPVLA